MRQLKVFIALAAFVAASASLRAQGQAFPPVTKQMLEIPSPDRLDEYKVEPLGLDEQRRCSGGMGEGAAASTRGDRTHESPGIVGSLVDAHTIAKECTAGDRRRRVDREDRNAATGRACPVAERGDQAALADSRGAGDADDAPPRRAARRESHERCRNECIGLAPAALHCADRLRQPPGIESVTRRRSIVGGRRRVGRGHGVSAGEHAHVGARQSRRSCSLGRKRRGSRPPRARGDPPRE